MIVDFALLIKIAGAAAAGVLLTWRVCASYGREWREREHLLDTFLPSLQDVRVGRSPWGYPRVEGLLSGSLARFDLIPDTLVFRSLPTLWLQVRWARRHSARLCVTVEQTGTEFFETDDEVYSLLHTLARWPRNTDVRGQGDSFSLLQQIERLDLTAYPSLKRLMVSENELKVTMRCARGDRLAYRVLRSAQFPPNAVSPELVAETLALLNDVEDTVNAEAAAL